MDLYTDISFSLSDPSPVLFLYIFLVEHMSLNSGLVIASGYAKKLKKTIFAQLQKSIKEGQVSSQEVARAIGELNSILFHMLTDKLRVGKGDVVRIRIGYRIEGGRIVWDPMSLSVEIYRRDDNAIEEIKSKLMEYWIDSARQIARYEVSKLADTALGNTIYSVNLDGKEVGLVLVLKTNNEVYISSGAVLKPVPSVVEKIRIRLAKGTNIEGEIARAMQRFSRQVSEDEARKIIELIRRGASI